MIKTEASFKSENHLKQLFDPSSSKPKKQKESSKSSVRQSKKGISTIDDSKSNYILEKT